MAETTWNPNEDGCIDIGRISTIRDAIDPGQRITNKLRLKMNIVDLIPCQFDINYSTMLKFDDNKLTFDFSPTIEYKKPVEKYMVACNSYGLKGYEYLRLHLTDISSVSDDMSNEYSKSVIDDAFNSLTSSRIGQLMQTKNKAMEALGKNGSDSGYLDNIAKALSMSEESKALVNLAADVVTHGSRVAFPKIWTNSSYSPNLNCVIKLVSPYGHPKAVNEFIIKPLSYLLILFSPSTGEGLITHRPSYFTLKSYGLSNLTLCYLGQMNIRRGGDDSSYNSFNQPLTVELSLTFNAVTEGFACFADSKEGENQQHKERNILKGDDSIALKTFENDFDQPNALFPTLKSMINSFRPYKFKDGEKEDANLNTSITKKTSTQTTSGLTSGGIISELPKEELNFTSKTKETTFDSISSVDVTVQDKTIVVFTLNDTISNLYELQILTDSGETQTKIIDIHQFTSDHDIRSLEKTDNTIVLTFNADEIPKVLKIRNVTKEIPGIWSDDVIINNEEPSKISTSIIPSYKSYTENIRWELKDNNNNQYGPYIGSPENSKNIENNTYKLQIVDLAGNIKYEENNIVITDNILNKQIILEEQYSDISTNFNIPQDLNINDFSYYLISDFNETTLLECFNNQKNTFTRGKYYYLVKYKDQIISKLNTEIDLSIIIDQSIVDKTITIERIDNDLKITSVV